MQINYNLNNNFKSLRQDKKLVEQLTKENKYTFAENNQKRIMESIEKIGAKGSKSGVEFLLNVAKNIRYSTNIKFNFSPKNPWLSALMTATSTAITVAGLNNSEEIQKQYSEVFLADKPLTEEEQEILGKYDSIISTLSSMTDKETLSPIDNNLQYFIISSETSLGDKKYILEKLEYLLSDEYQLNEQIQDKKVQVFSEIINDLALDKVNSEIPNIKAVDQLTHGMCAAISIVRKLTAYEYKRNYVDSVLSELDNTDNMMVYDRAQLGKDVKIPVTKAMIDYDKAIKNGFRIVDASVANWMNYADMDLANDDIGLMYVMYDDMNNGVYRDAHVSILSKDTTIPNQYEYHQNLSVTEDRLKALKSSIIKTKYLSEKSNKDAQIKLAEERNLYQENLTSTLKELLTTNHKDLAHDISTKLISNLKQKNAERLRENETIAQDYLYIDNEEPKLKKNKIKAFLYEGFSYALESPLNDKQVENIYELVETIQGLDSPIKPSQISIAERTVKASEAFKSQVMKACTIPERLTSYMVNLGFGDEDERFLENIDELITKVASGNKQIIEGLSKNIGLETANQGEVLSFLISCEEYIKSLPAIYDDLYKRMNLKNRFNALKEEVKNGKEILASKDADKINKLMSLVGIYSETKLAEIFDEAEDLMTHRTIIETFSQMFDCPAEQEKVLKTINAVINGINAHHDEDMVTAIAENLEIPNEAVIPTLINVSMGLSGMKNDEIYKTVAKKLNQFSIKQDFFQYHSALIQRFATGIEREFVEELLTNNGYPKEPTPDNLNNLMEKLLQDMQHLGLTINSIAENLHIVSEDGDIINSVYPPAIILKEYEKQGFIMKQADINRFNKRFEQIEVLYANKSQYSPKEFRRRLKELRTLSSEDKKIINNTLKHTNEMLRETSREKKFLFNAIKKYAEDIYRDYGVNTTGAFWNSLTPSSGLAASQQQAILEAITGKQHFIEKDIEKGIEQIKTGVHSGVSSTSVSDDSAAWHAQYVSSIEKVTVPSKNDAKQMVDKEILFHDNTWGALEKENTWVDSRGMLRTDYNSSRGYKYGYVTNSDLKNGTFVNDLLYKTGKITPDNNINNKEWKKLNPREEYTFSLIHDFILPGEDKSAISVAKQIRDSVLINEERLVNILEKEAAKMSPEQLKHKLTVLNKIGMTFPATYNEFEQRIKGNRFTKGIESEEDYNNLPKDDKLKITLERAALRATYKEVAFDEKISQIDSLDKIREQEDIFKGKIREKLYYSFGKRPELVKFLLSDKNRETILDQIITPNLEASNHKLEQDDVKKLLARKNIIEEVNTIGYDGSITGLANTFTQVLINRLTTILPTLSKDDVKTISDSLYNYSMNNLKIEKEDISSGEIPTFITKWLDKHYEIESDEQFIQIYNKIQNYTFEEFEKEIISSITDEDLAINRVTAYDLIKKIQIENTKAINILNNEIFFEEFDKIYEPSINKPYTRYTKLDNKVTGAYPEKTSFDEAYMLLRMSLWKLTYKKAFDAVKVEAYNRYNVLPAYPHLKNLEEEGIKESTSTQLALIKKGFNTLSNLMTQVRTFEAIEELEEFAKEHEGKTLSYTEVYQFNKKIDNLKKHVKESDKIFNKQLTKLTEPKDANVSMDEYTDCINKLGETKTALLKLCSLEEYKDKLDAAKEGLDFAINVFLEIKVPEKYRTKTREKINDWLRANRLGLDNAEALYEELGAFVDSNGAVQKPVDALNTFLLGACTNKDTELGKTTNPALKNTILNLLKNARILEVQEIIMEATQEGLTNAVASEMPNIDVTLYKKTEQVSETEDEEANVDEKEEFDEDGNIGNITIKQMTAPEPMSLLTRSLIIEDNFEHIKNFVEKFNLQEVVVPLLSKAPEFKTATEELKTFEKLKNDLVKEKKILTMLEEKINELPQLNTQELIDKTMEFGDILENSDYNKDENYFIDNLISTFRGIKDSKDIDALASLDTSITMMEVYESVLAECHPALLTRLKDVEDCFFNLGLIANGLDALNIDNYPHLKNGRDEALDEFGEILDKQNNIMREVNQLHLFG